MDQSMLGQGKKGKADMKDKGKNGKGSRDGKDDKDDKKSKGKKGFRQRQRQSQSNWVLRGPLPRLQTWGHTKKDCLWNQTPKGGKDTASLETASTAASQPDSTITGMLLQSNDCITAVDPTKWLFSVTNRETHP